VCTICRQLTAIGCFTLDKMNSQFQSLNFSYHDSSNKPPIVVSLDTEMLSFDASEMWCFLLHLPFAVGEFVSEDNSVWALYLNLRQIVDIAFSPSILHQEVDLLKVLIAEYLELRQQLFPLESLKNKHYHLTHYPRLIQQNGPMWCMRSKQKHQR